MSAHDLAPAGKAPDASKNGLLSGEALTALDPVEVPAKKKLKKKQRKEDKKRREFLERFPETPAGFDPTQPAEVDQKAQAKEPSPGRFQDWLRPASRTLNTSRAVLAQQASAAIAINCLMLSIAALAIYRGSDAGHLWWALIPLAVTNVLSLMFAILSARVDPSTTVDELCAMSEEDYEPALRAIIQDKEHLTGSLRRDLHRLGADLNRRQLHLRTAYNVLLGGIPISTLMFGLCIALSLRS